MRIEASKTTRLGAVVETTKVAAEFNSGLTLDEVGEGAVRLLLALETEFEDAEDVA